MDTIGFSRTAGGGGADAAYTAVVFASGDSGTVRAFNPAQRAVLYGILLQYVTAGARVRVRSPLMHDNVQGIAVRPGETPIRVSLPREAAQRLNPQDTLVVEGWSNLASEVISGALQVYYDDLGGANARLYMPGDIMPLIKNIKPMFIAAPENAAAGSWQNTVITTTEDLLKANQDYAILGYTIDRAEAAVGIVGPDTSNLRVCGPGDVRMFLTQSYFVDLCEESGRPSIPVFNSANKGATYATVLSQTTGGTPNLQLILAELERNLN